LNPCLFLNRSTKVRRVTPCAPPVQHFPRNAAHGVTRPAFIRQPGQLAVIYLLTVLISAGCRTAPPLPPADFSAPGWRVQQGQAVWKPTRNKLELAGELLLATNANGNLFVQFTKTPFPLATAQVSGESWQMEFGSGEYSWRGRGQPHARFVWFQLPRALAGVDLGRAWKLLPHENNSWHFENLRTGESLEVTFFQ